MTSRPLKLNRRGFLATGLSTAAALSVSRSRVLASSSEAGDIRIAVIGARGRGRKHIREFAANTVALCDVDGEVLAERLEEFERAYGRRLRGYSDYRVLLDDPGIDAVSIATPNHTHASIAIAAMLAGKDVYVEKPVSHNVWEGRQLVATAEETGRVVQCGTQARSSRAIRDAVAWVRSGSLGKVLYATGTCYKPRKGIGKLDTPLRIPAHIDFDLWCGPADPEPIYRPNLHYDWHWDYNTGAGDMGNQGIHQMDIARWFLGEEGLAPRVLSIGGRVGYDDAGNTANTQTVYYDYPSAPLIFETRGLPKSKVARANWGGSMDSYRGSQIGVVVQCECGSLLVPHTYDEVLVRDDQERTVKRFTGGGDHFGNFLDAVSRRDPSLANGAVEGGHISSALCHLGSLSHRLGEPASEDDIARAAASMPRLNDSWSRMSKHLRSNEVPIDTADRLVLGRWIEVDPAQESTTQRVASHSLWKRTGRPGFAVIPT